MLYLQIIAVVVLASIFIQDLLYRKVNLVFFPLLAIVLIVLNVQTGMSLKESGALILLNTSFLAIQFLLVSVYFSVKLNKWTNITTELLGWGDILFLTTAGCYLSFVPFIIFYIFSIGLILVLWLMLKWIFAIKTKYIPLAGFQAAMLCVLLIADWKGWNNHWIDNLIKQWTI
jgi:hypothetical protein